MPVSGTLITFTKAAAETYSNTRRSPEYLTAGYSGAKFSPYGPGLFPCLRAVALSPGAGTLTLHRAAPCSPINPGALQPPLPTAPCRTAAQHPASALGALAGCTELGSARPRWPNGSVALRVTSRARSQQGRLKEIFAGNSLISGLVSLCSMVCYRSL